MVSKPCPGTRGTESTTPSATSTAPTMFFRIFRDQPASDNGPRSGA